MAIALHDALRSLYKDYELNVSISSFWDCGWRVRLGDELNGFGAERIFLMTEFDQIGDWLLAEAPKYRRSSPAMPEPERLDQIGRAIGISPDQ